MSTGVRLDDDIRGALHALAAERAEHHRAPAVAYGVIGDGRLLAAGGVGDPGDGAGPPDERTLFRIASMTKSFTAAAVLRLRDAGRLHLDDPAAKHVPAAGGLRPPTSDSPAITVRHLLSMSAGLATDDPWADRHLDVAPPELLRWLHEGASFAAAPGTVFEYSNLGYGVLGQVVEAVAGMRLQDYVSRHFLEPLGLADTVWEAARARPGARLARPYRAVDGVAVLDAEPLGDGAIAPMGGLWSTAADLAVWVAFLADAFPPRDGADEGPLRRASRREMQQATRAIPAALVRDEVDGPLRIAAGGYGMGLEVREHLQLGTVITHSGGLPGFGSNMRWLPDRGVGVVGLANVTYVPMAALTRDALELLHERGALPPVAARSAPALERTAAELAALLSGWDDARAARLFADNVALDDPLDRRAAQAARLRALHGALTVESVTAERATRGLAQLRGERGRVRVSFQLSPRPDGRVQKYDVTSVLPASAGLVVAATRLAALAAAPDPAALAALLEADADVNDAARELEAAAALFGRFTVGAIVACAGVDGDGAERATLRWHGERGDMDVTLVLRAGRVRVDRLKPRPVPDDV
jgi:CubicO group peptidase (beta-lactamase class C family)